MNDDDRFISVVLLAGLAFIAAVVFLKAWVSGNAKAGLLFVGAIALTIPALPIAGKFYEMMSGNSVDEEMRSRRLFSGYLLGDALSGIFFIVWITLVIVAGLLLKSMHLV